MTMIMFDLETMATSHNAAIVSIGACEFDIDGNTSNHFYQNVSVQSNQSWGFDFHPETMNWWLDQDEKAFQALSVDPLPVFEALKKFRSSFPFKKAKGIWSHATFDFVIMNNALRTVGLPLLPYRQSRDIRTLSFLAPKIQKGTFEFEGTPHNALDDTLYQVKYVSAMLRRLRENHS